MSFVWPALLFSLLLVPLLAWSYVRLLQRRKKFAAQSGFGLMQVEGGEKGFRRYIPALFFLFGLAILLFSLSRPQAVVSLPKYEGTVVLVFDVSGSMAAKDIEPTRMEAAKSIAYELLKDQPANIRIGVVAFSDGGLTVQAPGTNREETLATIERLVPRRGTSLGNGMLVALNTIAVDAGDPPIINTGDLPETEVGNSLPTPQGWYPSAAILVLSDGENNQNPDPLAVTDLAIDLGVRVYTVGVGSVEGTTITVEGMNFHTALDDALLNDVSSASGGRYYFAGDENGLRRIYNDLEPALVIRPEALELTFLFAGLGLVVFLLGGMLSLLWLGRVL